MKKKSKNYSIEDEIINGLNNSDLSNLTVDLAEISLDLFLKDKFLKDLPIIGIITNIYKTSKNILEIVFTKKILVFLQETNKIDPILKKKFVDNLNNNQRKKRQTGETLIMIIEKSDSIEKVKIIANIFIAFLENKINYNTFKRISKMVNNANLTDLENLYNNSKSNKLNDVPYEVLENLAFTGFMHIGIVEINDAFSFDKHTSKLFYVPNNHAITLIKYGFKK
jgi:hypothetical protein